MHARNTWDGLINLSGVVALAAGFTVLDGSPAWQAARAQETSDLPAHVIATNIPGASAISQVGNFLTGGCSSPIPTLWQSYTAAGAILDPNRLLVGSRSNFGAPLAIGVGAEGSFLSIDPSGPTILSVPQKFAVSGGQASAPGIPVQMFSANSPNWINGINNPKATTANYTGVSNPLGLSNNNAFGRIWPANAPFGLNGIGSSTILDPDGRPLASGSPTAKAPNALIGGVYAGSLTNRDVVANPSQPQFFSPASLSTGAVGTALLGPSPDGSCKAVFAVVTADGAIVQEHTAKGLDGIAPAGTVHSLLQNLQQGGVDPRMGVLMNPYTVDPMEPTISSPRQLFVSEPFNNTIAVVNLVVLNYPPPSPNPTPTQVFGLGSVSRFTSPFLNMPVDLAPVQRDADDVNWASNTTLDDGSDFYVANRGNNTIVRMRQDGSVKAVRAVRIENPYLDGALLNGITTSTDGKTIYVTFTGPGSSDGGVLALHAFND
jgi:hypothetical protein